MPKSKKKQKQKAKCRLLNMQPYNLKLDNRINTAHMSVEHRKPFPRSMFEQEDFTKDLLDVGDSSNTFTTPSTSIVSPQMTTNTNTTTVTTASKFIGQKIPVKMREDIVRNKGAVQNPTVMNKKVNVQSNQLLKDCITSDIKTVVQDNIKTFVPRPQINNQLMGPPIQHPPRNIPFVPVNAAPRGVPRSFLTRANQSVIEPQLPAPEPNPFTNFIPPIQALSYNEPISHLGIDKQELAAIRDNHQRGNNTQTVTNSSFSTRYSPTDLYGDTGEEKKDGRQGAHEGSTSPEMWKSGDRRVSAFDRLGPMAQPKTPKLTINLSFNKEQAVREVVDETPPAPPPPAKVYIPVHEREDILHSTDETVMKYVGIWPWAKAINVRRTAKSKVFQQTGGVGEMSPVAYSPTAMMMLKEQMDEIYHRDNTFLALSVTGYPANWTKEDVLDAMFDNLKEKPFVPCFIEFNDQECKFLVIRNRAALLAIHALDFRVQKDDVQLSIAISQIMLTVLQLDFIPRLILRKRLATLHCEGTKLNLSAFTLQPDVSHFIYYPLNHLTNQLELMKLQTDIIWSNLTELDLSRNRLTTVEGFDLTSRLPRLRHLDLSHNRLESATALAGCRRLPLRSLRLEGNPLCHDFIDPQRYVTVVRMMFPTVRMLDDVPIRLAGEMPAVQPNYCQAEVAPLIDGFLQLYVPLLESPCDDRVLLADMYDEHALLTVTYRPKSDCVSEFRFPRSLLLLSRELLEGSREYASGKPDIEKLLRRWPNFEHDPSSFTVDVMFHCETSTVFRLDGIVKLPADSLAENDQLIAFSRTIHLRTSDGVEYKISNEMIYWDQPTEESVSAAFRRTLVKRKPLSFKLENPPDEECKKKLIEAFMKLTQLEEQSSTRCLELKDWDFREALDYFMKLYKADNLEPLTKPDSNDKS